MRYSLRTKLSLSYVFIALVSVLMLSLLANFFLERQFKTYTINKQNELSRNAVNMIVQQYKGGGKWDANTIESIGMSALEQGLIIKVTDSSGNMVWDAMFHNNGLCMQMLSHMAENMESRYPNWEGGYTENSYPLMYDFKQVGSVDIGYFGPYYFNDNDLAFINTLNTLLIAVGILSLLLSLIFGAVMARRLSRPLSKVTHTAQMISQGFYSEKIPAESNTKEIIQLVASINDLTETLNKQDLLRKRMSADVAHELRTPLATLQSYMEAMIDGIWDMDAERLKSCHEEIMRMSRLIGSLEELARYESDNLVLNKTEFDITELIQTQIRNFDSDFKNKGVRLDFAGQAAKITADRDKISQVIVNLLSNALKYTPEGGSTEVSVTCGENEIKIGVKDTGIGISQEDLPYVFERFYRADKSRNRMTGGSGIGLAIVRSVVNAHKGRISVASEIGKGSEFTVALPVSSQRSP